MINVLTITVQSCKKGVHVYHYGNARKCQEVRQGTKMLNAYYLSLLLCDAP